MALATVTSICILAGRLPNLRAGCGIASTPVIDLAKSVMYVVTRVRDGNDFRGRYFVNILDNKIPRGV